MTLLADLSSFLGSVWFAGLCAVCGYIAGNILPITKFKKD